MAKIRNIRTAFWPDPYIHSLVPEERLVFIYLLTNESTSLCGIYQITPKIISFYTGISEDSVGIILEKFEKDSRMVYIVGWLYIKNFVKYVMLVDNVSGTIKRAIGIGFKEIPKDILDKINQFDANFKEKYDKFL